MLLYINDKGLAARYGTHRTWAWRLAKEDPTFPPNPSNSPQAAPVGFCLRWRHGRPRGAVGGEVNTPPD